MSYVTDQMKQVLANHKLTRGDGDLYHMGKPDGDCAFHVHIGTFAGRICIAGDIYLVANGHGLMSASGYGIPWFASHNSEGYLCEKFLRQEWQWDAAVESIQWLIESDVRDGEGWWWAHADALRKFIAQPGWMHDEPCEMEYCDNMREIGHDVDDLPGYDYPRQQAGWLCAIQQRFQELYAEQPVSNCPT